MTQAITPLQGFWRLFRQEFFVLGGATLLLGVFLLGSAWTSLPLLLRGVETQGTMTIQSAERLICRTDSCPGGVRQGQTYYRVQRVYEFSPAEGAAVRFQRSDTLRSQPMVGRFEPVTITHVPGDRRSARPGTRAAMLGGLGLLLGLTALGLAGLLGLAGWRALQTRRVFALAARGQPRRATVSRAPGPLKGPAAKALHWTLPGGRTGHSLPLTPGALRPEPGARITVLDDGVASAWADQIAPDRSRQTPD